MDGPALSARNLGKTYVIHTRQATSLKEMVVRNLFVPGEKQPFRALDGVSFDLPHGRSLAVIGANGSGKSTLLKMMAGITPPDVGTLHVGGKVAALLEAGAGFQPEFTGMENIFLQCSILGLSRSQILERLDSILAFSQLDKFIHTPVKRYSSGMFVRLGFAIALHVDADILLLDEVLAVGDQAFQERCKDKIHELRRAGKTIVFVSHVMEQIESVADLVLWLDGGRTVVFGEARDILPRFHEAQQSRERTGTGEVHLDDRLASALPSARHAARRVRLRSAGFVDGSGAAVHSAPHDAPLRLRAEIDVLEPTPRLVLTGALGTLDALRAAWLRAPVMEDVQPGRYVLHADVEEHRLAPGMYLLSLMLSNPENSQEVFDLWLRLGAVALTAPDGTLAREEARLEGWGTWGAPGA